METKIVISKKLVLINTFSGVAARVINVGILLWLYQYLLKKISVEEYSLYPVLMSSMLFLSLLPTVLIGGLSRYIVEAYAKGDEQMAIQIVSTMSVLLFGAGLLVLAIGLAFSWYIDFVLTIVPELLWDARIMMVLLISAFVVQLVLSPFQAGLYVRQKFVLLNLINLGQQLLKITILFFLLFCVSTRVLWVVVATVSSNLCGIILIVVMSQRLVPALRYRRNAIRWPIAREITSFGGWSFIARLSEIIRLNADPIILNKLATPLDVTCFHLGSMPFRQIQGFLGAIWPALLPQLTAMHAAEAKSRLQSAFLRGGRLGLWVALFMSIPIMVYSHEFVELWVGGDKFFKTGVIMILLLAHYPISYGFVMLSAIAIAKANIRSLALRVLLIQVINLLLTFYLVGVRGMGAVGSALSTFLVYVLIFPVAIMPFGLRFVDIRITRWLRETLWSGILPGLAAAAGWILLKFTIHPSSWLELAGCAACGLLVYLVVLRVFCMQPQDRNDLKRVKAALLSYIPGTRQQSF